MNSPNSSIVVLAKRVETLRYLQEGIEDKRELEDRLDVSRSTLNRTLKKLEENHLIEPQPAGFRVTPGGKAALDAFTKTLEPLARALPILSNISGEIDIDPKFLWEATVIQATQPNPDLPMTRLDNLVEGSNRTLGISPAWMSHYREIFCERVLAGDLSADIVLNSDVVDYLSSEHDEETKTVLKSSRTAFYRAKDDLPYSMVIVDEEKVWLGIHDSDGILKGAIVNDTEDAINWAKEQFEAYRSESNEVEDVGV